VFTRRRIDRRRRANFAKDVAPIVFNNCASCHRSGEVAPMTLTSYEDVRPVGQGHPRKKCAAREMRVGRRPGALAEDAQRSQPQPGADRHIVAWVDGGAPRGSDADLPPLPKFADGWTFGREPDYILEMR